MTGHKQEKWLRPRARSPHTAPGCMRLGCRVGILQLPGLGSTDTGLRQASGLPSIPRQHWPDLPPAKDPGGSSRTRQLWSVRRGDPLCYRPCDGIKMLRLRVVEEYDVGAPGSRPLCRIIPALKRPVRRDADGLSQSLNSASLSQGPGPCG